MFAILLLIILRSLPSVLCLNCSDVRQSNELGVYVRRHTNANRTYWVYDRNGKEWEFNITEKNGQMDIDHIDNKTFSYDRTIVNRFSNYFAYKNKRSVYNCELNRNSIVIVCRVLYEIISWEKTTKTASLHIKNPLVLKSYPKEDQSWKANYWMAYNRHNKSERVRLKMFKVDGQGWVEHGVYVETDRIEDIQFIGYMNDTLFSQIDSTLDYNWDPDRELSGYMLWFNIDHKYYYCFQPEGQPLSEQV